MSAATQMGSDRYYGQNALFRGSAFYRLERFEGAVKPMRRLGEWSLEKAQLPAEAVAERLQALLDRRDASQSLTT